MGRFFGHLVPLQTRKPSQYPGLDRCRWRAERSQIDKITAADHFFSPIDFQVTSRNDEHTVEAIEQYGSVKKELVILGNSAHFAQRHEPETFFQLVTNFIEGNK
ncbi:MAG: hypothetical protein HC880_10550 [Bacteroidia bacterium]|nr:hypothetical protein [Bacteroidia bacterium]